MRWLVGLVLILISSTAFAATSERFGKGGWLLMDNPDYRPRSAAAVKALMASHC